jgi:hypothetical protein
LQRWLDHELEVMVNMHEVRFEYEKQSQVYVSSILLLLHLLYIATFLKCIQSAYSLELLFRQAALAEELDVMKQVDRFSSNGQSPPRGKNGCSRYITMKFSF